MQRLEVSGAVRPLYGSLGVKGLLFLLRRVRYAERVQYLRNSTHFDNRRTPELRTNMLNDMRMYKGAQFQSKMQLTGT